MSSSGLPRSAPGFNPSTATRSLVGIDRSNGFVIENLTMHNLTPQGGSQAEALRMQTCDKCMYQSTDAAGAPLDASGRTGGKQITAAEAMQMRDPAQVLGGWTPPK